ncbi:MAG: hypothetical protein IME99_04125 [Proteobacteria bacterium]|nr:hypothetical protein [Pseudomonadota bacterium]
MMDIKGFFHGSNRFALVLSFALLMVVVGCSSGSKDDSGKASAPAESAQTETAAAPGADSLPADHPAMPEGMDKMTESIQRASHANIKTQKEVVLTDEMKAKWNEVQIAITDNANQRTENVTLKVGSKVKLTQDGYFLTIDAFVPDYAIAESKIVSRSDEANNPAMLVSLYENETQVTRGWVFKDFSEFNSYSNSRFVLQLTGPGSDRPAVPAPAAPQKTH